MQKKFLLGLFAACAGATTGAAITLIHIVEASASTNTAIEVGMPYFADPATEAATQRHVAGDEVVGQLGQLPREAISHEAARELGLQAKVTLPPQPLDTSRRHLRSLSPQRLFWLSPPARQRLTSWEAYLSDLEK